MKFLAGVVFELANEGVFAFVIEGGEPLLHPSFETLIGIMDRANVGYTVVTNGTMVDRASAEVLAHSRAQVIVSIDSMDPDIHNSIRGRHNEAIAGLERLLKEDVTCGINTVVTSRNIDTCHEIIDAFYPRVRRFGFLRLIARGANDAAVCDLLDFRPEQSAALRERLRERARCLEDIRVESPFNLSGEKSICAQESISTSGCLAGTTFATIRPSGDVLPCSYCQTVVLGNLGRQSLRQVWHSPAAQSLRESGSFPCLEQGRRMKS